MQHAYFVCIYKTGACTHLRLCELAGTHVHVCVCSYVHACTHMSLPTLSSFLCHILRLCDLAGTHVHVCVFICTRMHSHIYLYPHCQHSLSARQCIVFLEGNCVYAYFWHAYMHTMLFRDACTHFSMSTSLSSHFQSASHLRLCDLAGTHVCVCVFICTCMHSLFYVDVVVIPLPVCKPLLCLGNHDFWSCSS